MRIFRWTKSSFELYRLLTLHIGKIPNGILPLRARAAVTCSASICVRVATRLCTGTPDPFWGANVWNEGDLYFVAETFDSLLFELHGVDVRSVPSRAR